MINERYVLITPARNEAAFIEHVLRSVVSQTMLPKKWVIVSDASTDGTDDIVRLYAKKYEFIALRRQSRDGGRDFCSKAFAIRNGLKQLEMTDFGFIGILDADVSFGKEYFQRLFEYFERRPKLGIAGGAYYEFHKGKYRPKTTNRKRNIPGGIQMFRRACFEQIGGLLPLELSGEDTVAGVMARMHGWQVHSLNELPVRHLRLMGSAGGSLLQVRFREGKMDYVIGYHPLYESLKFFRRITETPWLLGSCLRLAGYWWSA